MPFDMSIMRYKVKIN